MAKVLLAQRYTEYAISGTNYPYSTSDFRIWYYVYYDDAQDVANNRTKIITDIYIQATNGNIEKNSGWSLNLTAQVNGSNYTSALPNKTYYEGTTYTGISKEVWASHASNGTGSFTWRGLFSGYYSGGTTGTTTYTLPTIPRSAYINNYSVWNNGLSQIGVWWTADKAIDAVQYSLSGGAWTGTSGNTFYINGLNPGTKYSVKIRVKATDSQLWTESSTLYATTTDIAKITNSNVNFDVDNGITVNFTNPSGSKTDVWIEGLNQIGGTAQYGIPIRESVSSPFVYTLTQTEKNTLFSNNPTRDKFPARVCVRTANNNAYIAYKDGYGSITNANPIFSNFDYEDINPSTLDFTGDNQTIIKDYSNLKATITSANKMVAIKGANPTEYQLVVGSKQIKKDYHESNNVDLTLNAIDNNVFIVYAIDSRSNSTQKQISPSTYIDYFKPTISEVKVSRQNNISTFTNLSFSGAFFNENFGVENNVLIATYQYRKTTSEEWIDGDTELTLTINDNNFSFGGLIAGDLNAEGFTMSESYEIKVVVSDLLESFTSSEVLVSAKPNLAMYKDGVALNGQYDENLESGVQLNGDGVYYNGLLLFGWSEE